MTPTTPESPSPTSTLITGLIAVVTVTWVMWRITSSLRERKRKHQQTGDRVVMVSAATNVYERDSSSTPFISSSKSDHSSKDDSIEDLIRHLASKPPHAAATKATTVLLDDAGGGGVLPFRFCKAAQYESDASRLAIREGNKRDRARVLAKLFTSSRPIFTPPAIKTNSSLTRSTVHPPPSVSSLCVLPFEIPGSKGCHVIIVIQEQDIRCRQLSRILFLLGTYYNLFVIIDVKPQQDDCQRQMIQRHNDYKKHHSHLQSFVQTLRGGDETLLPEDVLPSHRIVIMNTVTGKVAFIRNFPKKVEFIVEYDTAVVETLVKFGFTILVYNNKNSQPIDPIHSPTYTSTNPISSLARDLL